MASKVLNLFLCVFVTLVAAVEVSAQTHHYVGGEAGWSSDSDITSWLSGRVFRVGDKIWFNTKPGTEESIVEVESQEELESCDLSNPIKMYTEPTNYLDLDKQGIRYFSSGDLQNCKNGLKLPVHVQPNSQFPFDTPPQPFNPFGPQPFNPFEPSPPTFGPPQPEPSYPPPTFGPPPPEPFYPPPTFEPPPPVYVHSPPPPPSPSFRPPSPPPPSPSFRPPPPTFQSPPPPSPPFYPPGLVPPPPTEPSASSNLNGLSVVLFVGLGFYFMGLDF